MNYDILGISKHATIDEIKRAYKKQALKFHPDKTLDEQSKTQFIKIKEAYDQLITKPLIQPTPKQQHFFQQTVDQVRGIMIQEYIIIRNNWKTVVKVKSNLRTAERVEERFIYPR